MEDEKQQQKEIFFKLIFLSLFEHNEFEILINN
jgi:hypothetical protein